MDFLYNLKWFFQAFFNYFLSQSFEFFTGEKKIKMDKPEVEVDLPKPMEMSILDLNDDCLFQIFDFLNRKDLIELSEVNDKFYYAAHRVLSRRKTLDIKFHRFDVSAAERIFRTTGGYLKQINLSIGYSIPTNDVATFLTELVEHCINLEELTINYVDLKTEFVEILQKVAPQLRVLDLCYCNLDDDVANDLFVCCDNLQELYIMGNYRFDGRPLKHLLQLGFLSIERLSDDIRDELIDLNPKLVISSLPFK